LTAKRKGKAFPASAQVLREESQRVFSRETSRNLKIHEVHEPRNSPNSNKGLPRKEGPDDASNWECRVEGKPGAFLGGRREGRFRKYLTDQNQKEEGRKNTHKRKRFTCFRGRERN